VTDTSKAARPSSRFELSPMPADLAEQYLAEGWWDERTLGQLLYDALSEDPGRRFRIWSPTNPYVGTVLRPVCVPTASARVTSSRSSCPTGSKQRSRSTPAPSSA